MEENRRTRFSLIENKKELSDDEIAEIIELKHEHIDISQIPPFTDKAYRDLSKTEKNDLIQRLINEEEYLNYKNCYISKTKLLYDSSETLIKEIETLKRLNELGYEVYLLPYAYARDGMNYFQKSADTITFGSFLELKSVVSAGERAGQSTYEDARNQADNVYLSFINNISEEKAINNIHRSIGVIKKSNKENGKENNFEGLLFLNFEKENRTVLYQVSKNGRTKKLESPAYEYLKKIKGIENDSQVVENPLQRQGSSRISNIQDFNKSVNSKLTASPIPQKIQSISDSVLSFEQNNKDILEIIGKQFETDSSGKPTLNGIKSLSKAMEIYSDKHFETARYLFVKDGLITRHIAVSSQTPSSTVIKPDENFLYNIRTYAKETGSQIIFLHNHPSGYVEPSEADIKLTEYLHNFFTDADGSSYFLGHIILDHGTFGLYDSKERKWNALIDDKIQPLQELQKNYGIQLSELGSRIEFNNNRTIAEHSVIELAELAKKCDSENMWNTKDWIPAFMMTGNGVVTSLEYINVLEFNNSKILEDKLKTIGREVGSESIIFIPRLREQFLICERFAQDSGKVREVIYEKPDGTFELSGFSNGNIFNDLRIDDIIIEDSEQNKNQVEEKLLYEQSVNKNNSNQKENKTMKKMTDERVTVENSHDNMMKKESATNYVLEKLSKAGIEVVTDKEEFERILEQEDFLLKMINDETFKNTSKLKEITSENKKLLVELLKQSSEKFIPVVYSWENYRNIFPSQIIESPIESIKLGSNQFIKLAPGNRNNFMLAIRNTLEKPSIILAKETFDEKTETFKPVHVYGKSFVNENESKKTVESIIIFKQNDKIVISLHPKPIEKFVNQIKTTNDIVYLDDEVSRVIGELSITKGDNVVKENESFLSRIRQVSYSSLKQMSYPSMNKKYNRDSLLSSKEFIEKYGIETGNLEITKENFDKYFNILFQHDDFKNNRNKTASELFNYHVKPEHKIEMKNWLEKQGYLIKEKSVEQFMTLSNGTTYGFTHEGKIYLNPDVMNSNAAVHEYTHLWDSYTQKTDPELWQKGLTVFKDTNYWKEVLSDPNYQDIKDDENLVLSEIHGRICGKMAEKTLEKIAELDGEQVKFDAIDWDREVNEFIAEEFGIKPELGTENYISDSLKATQLKEFLSAPMKDLFINERSFEIEKKNKQEQSESLNQSDIELSDLNKENSAEIIKEGLHKSFEYDGLTYIPVRSLSKEEKEIINNRTPKEIWENAIIEKPKNGDDYSLNEFIEKAQAETGNESADLFYCIEKGKFFTPVENGIVNLNENSINEHFNAELQKFYNSPDIQNIIKTNRPLVFDKTKDMELTNNLTSVISDGEVFTQRNENLGDIRVKLGNLKHGGINHIIKRRMDKLIQHDGKSYDEAVKETSAILFLAVKNISEAPATKEPNGRFAVYKNGIKTVIGKDDNGRYVVSGFDFKDTKKEATDSIKSVNALYGYTPEFLEIYAQVGAAYASLSNNINYNNSLVNKHIPEETQQVDEIITNEVNSAENVSEKESELLKENTDLLKQNKQFEKMLERLTNEITSLRKENEAIKQQVFADKKQQSAQDSLFHDSHQENQVEKANNEVLLNPDGFGRSTAYKVDTIVPKFGIYNKNNEIEFIENARFSKFIENKVSPGYGNVILEIPQKDGKTVEFKMDEEDYNKLINAVDDLERMKQHIDPNSYEWKIAHSNYMTKLNLDENIYRLNSAGNFLHNFRIQCRHNNAHNPKQALKIAGIMFEQMPPLDRERHLSERRQYEENYGKGSYDLMLIKEYEENHGKININIDNIQKEIFNQEKVEEDMAVIYKTLKSGDEIENTKIKVGDSIPIAMTIKSSVNRQNIKLETQDWKIMSVQKGLNRNQAVLYNEAAKSYQTVPLNMLVNHIHKIEKSQAKEKQKHIKKQHKDVEMSL